MRFEVTVVRGTRPTHHTIACLAFESILFVCEQRLWLMVGVAGQLLVVLCCLISASTRLLGSQWEVDALGRHMNYVYKPYQNFMPVTPLLAAITSYHIFTREFTVLIYTTQMIIHLPFLRYQLFSSDGLLLLKENTHSAV